MRYEIIRKNEGLRFQKECPLLIVGSAITKDNQKDALLAQIKFLNISSKKISALYIQVQGIGADGEPFFKLDQFAYLDLDVDGFAEFGANTPLYLSNIQTRDLIIACQKIIYEDDSVWQSNLETNFIKLSLANSVEALINAEALVGNDYLNRWLDTEFMQKAFSVEEQKHSKVQLLELSTLKSDFPNDSDRAATPTQYARSKSNSNSSKTTCEYWYDHKSILNLEKDYEAPLISERGHFSPSLGQYMLSPNYVRPELIYYREPLK